MIRHWFVQFVTAPLFIAIAGAQLMLALLDSRTFGVGRGGDIGWVSLSQDQFGFWLAVTQALFFIATSAFAIIFARTR